MKEKIRRAKNRLDSQDRAEPRNQNPPSFDTVEVKKAVEGALSTVGRTRIEKAGTGTIHAQVVYNKGGPPSKLQLKDLASAFGRIEDVVGELTGVEVSASLVRIDEMVWDVVVAASG